MLPHLCQKSQKKGDETQSRAIPIKRSASSPHRGTQAATTRATKFYSLNLLIWILCGKGVYDGRLVVSAGLSNTTWVPRLFNPTEVVYIKGS